MSVHASRRDDWGSLAISSVALILVSAPDAFAQQAAQWRVEDGGNGHWYQRVAAPMTWSQSKDYCEQQGGHLATLTSAAEHGFIASKYGGARSWLGGFQNSAACEPLCSWQWVTGEAWSFSNWASGEPSDSSGTEDRLEILATGGWSDHSGDGSSNTICEWSADCNGDGLVDYGQILAGQLPDGNANNIPDCCEGLCETVTVPGNYPNIQSAIDTAPASVFRTVLVAAGTYAGPISLGGRDVLIKGAGAGVTTLSGGGAGNSAVVVFSGGEPSYAGIEGVTVRDGTTGSQFPTNPSVFVGGGVFGHSSAAGIRNCVIEFNYSGFGGGAYLFQCTSTIENTSFYANNADSDGGGLLFFGGAVTMNNCTITGNVCVRRGGGLHAVFGNHVLNATSVTTNRSFDRVGAVSWAPAGSASASLRLVECSVQDNDGDFGVGGVLADPSPQPASLFFESSTICGNVPRPNIVGPHVRDSATVVCDCFGDLNSDEIVNGVDLAAILSVWGTGGGSSPQSDINRDGVVDALDLGFVLSSWGVCEP